MSADVERDQLAVIKIEGMHCHKCEQSIQRSLMSIEGVHEAEVDFNSGQASILFKKSVVNIKQLMETINAAGYRAIGFSQGQR